MGAIHNALLMATDLKNNINLRKVIILQAKRLIVAISAETVEGGLLPLAVLV